MQCKERPKSQWGGAEERGGKLRLREQEGGMEGQGVTGIEGTGPERKGLRLT